MDSGDLHFVEHAVKVLERPSFLTKVSLYLGRPISYAAEQLPERVQRVIHKGVNQALTAGLRVAISSMNGDPEEEGGLVMASSRKWRHTFAVMGLGASSGFVGGWAMALELPITTTLMMRSIASMAHAAGFDPRDPRTALEILTVFAYGNRSAQREAGSDTAFLVQRAAFDVLIRDGASFISGKTAAQVMAALEQGAAPKLIELLAKIGARMNIIAGEKFFAQSLPVIGAAGGAAINGLFNDHYSTVAYYAFGLKRLEQQYGEEKVRQAYDAAFQRIV